MYQQGTKAKVQNLWYVNLAGVWRKGKLWKFVNVPPKLTPQVSACLLKASLAKQESSIILPRRTRTCYWRRKKFKERNHYQFCWAKNSTIYLRKDESSRVTKISGTDTLRRLALDTKSLNHYKLDKYLLLMNLGFIQEY